MLTNKLQILELFGTQVNPVHSLNPLNATTNPHLAQAYTDMDTHLTDEFRLIELTN